MREIERTGDMSGRLEGLDADLPNGYAQPLDASILPLLEPYRQSIRAFALIQVRFGGGVPLGGSGYTMLFERRRDAWVMNSAASAPMFSGRCTLASPHPSEPASTDAGAVVPSPASRAL